MSDIPEDGIIWIDRTINGMRSFWMGFQMDVFNKDQSKINTGCLDNQSKNDMA